MAQDFSLNQMSPMSVFVAIDFETADYEPVSACAVGLVRVEGEEIAVRRYELIRPPRQKFIFTGVHGLTWGDVRSAGGFKSVWRELLPIFDGAQFIAAHNAPFDRSVLEGCCRAFQVRIPNIPFLCTMRLARNTWGIRPTKLDNVCRHLKLKLNHHHALSDADACARIVIAASRVNKKGRPAR